MEIVDVAIREQIDDLNYELGYDKWGCYMSRFVNHIYGVQSRCVNMVHAKGAY